MQYKYSAKNEYTNIQLST